MSDYERMVSYFYCYENGRKSHNVGFGKVERRGELLRVTLNLSDNARQQDEVTLYLYRRSNGTVSLNLLGKAQFCKGVLEYHEECSCRERLPQNTPLSDYEGLLVYYCDSLFYGSLWTEEPMPIPQLLGAVSLYKKPKQENAFYQDEKIRIQNEPVSNTVQKEEDRKLASRTADKEKAGTNISLELEQEINKESVVAAENESDTTTEETYNQERFQQQLMDWKVETDAKEFLQSSVSSSTNTTEDNLTGIPYLLKHREHLPDVSNHTITRCVRIATEDIGLMERGNWSYGNNSFVLHGYYNYHYLMLGLMQYGDGSQQYVLGVPGIYTNKDKYLADIFHFQEFVPQNNCQFKTGEFGYWIVRLRN